MRTYPAFIIDRSRRSKASRFADDFIVCTDKELGFIARVYTLPKSRVAEYNERLLTFNEVERDRRFYAVSIRGGEARVVLEVEQMLHAPTGNWSRLPSLMKKAMKAYLYGEAQEVVGDGTAIDRQIAAVKDLLRTMESQRGSMIDANGEGATTEYINATRGALESLELLKKILSQTKMS